MPKKTKDVELARLVHHEPSDRRTSPLAPSDTNDQLPNVPSYQANTGASSSNLLLPPVTKREKAGVLNPGFLSEELSPSGPLEPLGSCLPAVSVEDVDPASGTAGGEEHGPLQPPISPYRTLAIPGPSAIAKRKCLPSQEESLGGTLDLQADDGVQERAASSISQSSSIVHERLQELVRLFKDRTEKVKEMLIDPEGSSDEESPTASPSKKAGTVAPPPPPPPEEKKELEEVKGEEHYCEMMCCKFKTQLWRKRWKWYKFPSSIDPLTNGSAGVHRHTRSICGFHIYGSGSG